MKYTDELVRSIRSYNDNLEEISQKILNLKIDFNENDIEMRHLYELSDSLSVINNMK